MERRVLAALIHALTAPEASARPRCTAAVAETLRQVHQNLTPVPEAPPNFDEELDMAQAVSELGLPLTVYQTSDFKRRRDSRRKPIVPVAPIPETRGLSKVLAAARTRLQRT